jgi:hypothetical protein
MNNVSDSPSDPRDPRDPWDPWDLWDPRDPRSAVTVTTTFRPTPPASAASSTSSSFLTPQDHQTAMVLGIDSLGPCGPALLANAKTYLGKMPQFWGRYFYAPGQRNAAGQVDSHYSSAESDYLRAQNIRVLPIARQTSHVSDATRARNDAVQNVAAILEVFPAQYLSGADPNVLVFLDVEQNTPLASDYYDTWSATVISEADRLSGGRVRFHPSIYGGRAGQQTWVALKQAMDNGAPCDGIWIARYYYPTAAPKPWDDGLTTPVTPPGGSLLCPLLAWQYWASPDDAPETANFDTNIANPTHADMLISRLVMPPAASV